MDKDAVLFSDEELQESLKNRRLLEINALLDANERACIRPLRALASGMGIDADKEKLAALEVEAAALRAERATLI